MPLVHANGQDLFYSTKGEGESLVFINGLSGDHLYWNGQLRAFSKHFHCIAVDSRDVGQSSYASSDYSTKDLANDLADLLALLGIPSAHVVGLSMGGMVAQELALARPEVVRSLVLAGTAAKCDPWFLGTLNAFEIIRRSVPDTASFFEAILPWWVSHRFLESSERTAWLRWLLRQNPYPQSLDGFIRQLNAIRSHDALDRLREIRCPVLAMTGEDDSVMPPRFARQLCDRLPQAKVVILPGVGHAPPIEEPQLFNLQLSQFLSEVAKAAPSHGGAVSSGGSA